MRRRLLTLWLLGLCGGLISAPAWAKNPDCPSSEPPTVAALHLLKRHGLIPDDSDSVRIFSNRLAKEKTGLDRYRQLTHLRFTLADGRQVEAIAKQDVSAQSCSISAMELFVIRETLTGRADSQSMVPSDAARAVRHQGDTERFTAPRFASSVKER